MRKSALIGALLALGATLSADFGRLDLSFLTQGPGAPRGRIQKRPKGYRNGRGLTYKHSSKRQQARYARQIAAGQIRNAPCVTW